MPPKKGNFVVRDMRKFSKQTEFPGYELCDPVTSPPLHINEVTEPDRSSGLVFPGYELCDPVTSPPLHINEVTEPDRSSGLVSCNEEAEPSDTTPETSDSESFSSSSSSDISLSLFYDSSDSVDDLPGKNSQEEIAEYYATLSVSDTLKPKVSFSSLHNASNRYQNTGGLVPSTLTLSVSDTLKPKVSFSSLHNASNRYQNTGGLVPSTLPSSGIRSRYKGMSDKVLGRCKPGKVPVSKLSDLELFKEREERILDLYMRRQKAPQVPVPKWSQEANVSDPMTEMGPTPKVKWTGLERSAEAIPCNSRSLFSGELKLDSFKNPGRYKPRDAPLCGKQSLSVVVQHAVDAILAVPGGKIAEKSETPRPLKLIKGQTFLPEANAKHTVVFRRITSFFSKLPGVICIIPSSAALTYCRVADSLPRLMEAFQPYKEGAERILDIYMRGRNVPQVPVPKSLQKATVSAPLTEMSSTPMVPVPENSKAAKLKAAKWTGFPAPVPSYPMLPLDVPFRERDEIYYDVLGQPSSTKLSRQHTDLSLLKRGHNLQHSTTGKFAPLGRKTDKSSKKHR